MKCEAGIHSFFCKGEGTTTDHMTPKCLGRLDEMKWVFEKDNFQHLDERCHALKDFDTPERLELRLRQIDGKFISLTEYLEQLSFEVIHTTEWDEKELSTLLKTYINRPAELAMILEEMVFLSPLDWDYNNAEPKKSPLTSEDKNWIKNGPRG